MRCPNCKSKNISPIYGVTNVGIELYHCVDCDKLLAATFELFQEKGEVIYAYNDIIALDVDRNTLGTDFNEYVSTRGSVAFS